MTFLRLAVDANVTQAKGVVEERAMLADRHSEDLLLAAWTGNCSTGIFVLDGSAAVRDALN